MKNRYRIIAITLVLILLLTGCNIVPAPTNPTTTETVDSTPSTVPQLTQPTEPEANVVVQYLPKEVDNPENIPVLKWVVMTEYRFGGINQARSEDAVHELNQMLADKDMPFRVQFLILSLDAPNSNSNWFSRPEALEVLEDADLVWGNMVADEMREYLLPITEYVTGGAEPSLENAVAHDLNWLNATLEGEIYGIPSGASRANSVGWEIDPVLLTEIGLAEKDFQRNFWEMDDVFAKIYERNGNEPFLYFGHDGITTQSDRTGALPVKLPSMVTVELEYTYQLIGAYFGIDHSGGKPVVVNVLESDMCRDVRIAKQRFQNAGYAMTVDELHDEPDKLLLRYTVLEGNSSYTDAAGNRCIPTTPSCYNSSNLGNYSGVIAVSQHKEEALQLLKLITEDKTFLMQMCYGKEGRDYEIVDGYYTIITQNDGSRYNLSVLSMLDNFSSMMPSPEMNGFAGSLFTTQVCIHEGKTELETYQYNLDNIGFIYYPIIFDYSGLEQEVTAIDKILHNQEYFRNFLKKSEEDYSQILQELKAAGSEKIQAELQRQLDEWLAANPDWQ